MKKDRKHQCKARQHSDQMLCECGLAWDVNDPDPPACRRFTEKVALNDTYSKLGKRSTSNTTVR